MKIPSDSHEPEVRIEIVPLIDVIFCILTFFILAAVTLTRQNAINVDLPRAATGTTQMRKLLIVTVDPIGQTYVEKQPVSREQLYQTLLNFRTTSPEGTMVLYASRAASYNDVVQVLDLLQSVGGDRVALATLPGSTSAELTLPSTGSSPLPNLNTLPGSNNLPNSSGSSTPQGSPAPLPASSAPYNLNPSGSAPSQSTTGASTDANKARSIPSKP